MRTRRTCTCRCAWSPWPLQHLVHLVEVEVTEQGGNHPALGNALLPGRLQHHLEQVQHIIIAPAGPPSPTAGHAARCRRTPRHATIISSFPERVTITRSHRSLVRTVFLEVLRRACAGMPDGLQLRTNFTGRQQIPRPSLISTVVHTPASPPPACSTASALWTTSCGFAI